MVDGREALAIDVLKTQGANTVDVAERVTEAVAEMQEDPDFEGIDIRILRDSRADKLAYSMLGDVHF